MKITYYYSIISPFSYLGGERLKKIIDQYSIELEEKPFDIIGQIFPNTGGLPVPQRHPSRQTYRLLEIERWGKELDMPINIKPKFFPPSDMHKAALFTLAAINQGNKISFGQSCLKSAQWNMKLSK